QPFVVEGKGGEVIRGESVEVRPRLSIPAQVALQQHEGAAEHWIPWLAASGPPEQILDLYQPALLAAELEHLQCVRRVCFGGRRPRTDLETFGNESCRLLVTALQQCEHRAGGDPPPAVHRHAPLPRPPLG